MSREITGENTGEIKKPNTNQIHTCTLSVFYMYEYSIRTALFHTLLQINVNICHSVAINSIIFRS